MADDLSSRLVDALKKTKDQATFIQHLLRGCLDWPYQDDHKAVADVSFEWKLDATKEGFEEKIVDRKMFQLQPLAAKQPWGIFLIEFASAEVFTKGGMVGPLRRILRALVRRKYEASADPRWPLEHLLFICTHKYEYYRIAYFKAPPKGSRASRLASFSWDPQTPARTVCTHNLPKLQWPAPDTKLDEWVQHWAQAFDVERVTADFYRGANGYFDVFSHFMQRVKGTFAKGREEEDRRLFTQQLFNRLMFLRFIERKGWLKLGDKTDGYLQALYKAGPGFYTKRLRPLFFEALAEDTKKANPALGTVPFLNGGLFMPTELDALVEDIPDDAFERLIGPNGLFYRYNFTVEESTPLDVEVAVDPEMLGKVFEELVTGRHESGSFYTPRNVVSFMCREALKGYLQDKTGIDSTQLSQLVDNRDVSGLNPTQIKAILDVSDSFRAVDPACGSGAYLLGLLHEALDLKDLLLNPKAAHDPVDRYKRKLELITRGLYGVDIDPFATNIAMLRLWLSLAVESDKPQPLPNLLYNIETGDSLLAPDPSPAAHEYDAKTKDAFALKPKVIAAEMRKLKIEATLCHDHAKFKKLEKQIAEHKAKLEEIWRIKHDDESVDWRIEFADVFTGERGFDIVLANPPYVRQELIKELKPALKNAYPTVFQSTADLYCYFYARALQLLRPSGMLVFISSNKWFRADYGTQLRDWFARHTIIQSVTDFRDLPVFESAIAYPMIFVARKAEAKEQRPFFTAPPSLEPPYPDVWAAVNKYGAELPKEAVTPERWLLADKRTIERIQQMEKAGVPLGQYVDGEIYRGILTGYNKAFVIDGDSRARLIKKDAKSEEIIKPLVSGKEIKRWRVTRKDRWLIVTEIDVDMKRYPAVMQHLSEHEKPLKKRQDQGKRWWELRSCDYYDKFSLPKIIFPDIAARSEFAFDTEGSFVLNTAYIIPRNDLFLVGVLNSLPVLDYYANISAQVRGGYFRFIYQYVEQIPVPKATTEQQKTVAALVSQCISRRVKDAHADVSEMERQIDNEVLGLFGLDPAKEMTALLADSAVASDPKKDAASFAAYVKNAFGEDDA